MFRDTWSACDWMAKGLPHARVSTWSENVCEDPGRQKHIRKDRASFQESLWKDVANEIRRKSRESPRRCSFTGPVMMETSNPVLTVHYSSRVIARQFSGQQDVLRSESSVHTGPMLTAWGSRDKDPAWIWILAHLSSKIPQKEGVQWLRELSPRHSDMDWGQKALGCALPPPRSTVLYSGATERPDRPIKWSADFMWLSIMGCVIISTAQN